MFKRKDIEEDIEMSESDEMQSIGNISFALTAIAKLLYNVAYAEEYSEDVEERQASPLVERF
jgi:hypothetical protein